MKQTFMLFLVSLVVLVSACTSQNQFSEKTKEQDISIEDKHWNRMFSKAFEPVDCPLPRDPNTLPDGYYKGPMIDTHIHLQSLPDGAPGMPDESYTGENIGTKRSIAQWVCMMDVEGTKQAFGFFPVWDPIVEESVTVVRRTMENYPDRFVPFIMPPDDDGSKDGYPTVDAKTLEEMLAIESGLFKGYGEIGLYAREDGALALSPDSQRLMEIYPIVRKNRLVVYLHLGEGQGDALERAAKANRDITFIFHGDQLIDCEKCDNTHRIVAGILERNPNVYYGVDELYGGEWLLQPGKKKEEFLAHFADYEPLLEKDLAKFKEFIESHPDQVIWGTDRGVSTSWDRDPDVALVLNNYSRAFIGKLDPAVQEKFAYKNAERIFSKEILPSQQEEKTGDGRPVLNGLGVDFGDENSHGDFLFDKAVLFEDSNIKNNKVLLEFGVFEHMKRNPNQNIEYWYFLKPDTKITSVVGGTVSISFIEHTKDWAVHVRNGNEWTVSFEHLKNVQVKEGDIVKPGDVLGEAVPWSANKNVGFTELAVWEGGRDGIYKYCPFDFLDEELTPLYREKIHRLTEDWEEFIDEEVYAQESWTSPGCMAKSVKEA